MVQDAYVSYKWRNTAELWKYTRFNVSEPVTLEKELQWIHYVLSQKDQLRFAICLSETHEYIGNVQLLKLTNLDAEFHLFIGNQEFWGMGLGKIATQLMLEYAFSILNLKKIWLEVHADNLAAAAIYKKHGFVFKNKNSPFLLMEVKENEFKRSIVYEESDQTLAER